MPLGLGSVTANLVSRAWRRSAELLAFRFAESCDLVLPKRDSWTHEEAQCSIISVQVKNRENHVRTPSNAQAGTTKISILENAGGGAHCDTFRHAHCSPAACRGNGATVPTFEWNIQDGGRTFCLFIPQANRDYVRMPPEGAERLGVLLNFCRSDPIVDDNDKPDHMTWIPSGRFDNQEHEA